MRNLKEFLIVKFRSDTTFQIWKEKFPNMFAFAEQVTVLPWSDEFGIADKHPEALDELEFYEELRKNGLISDEEFEEKLKELHRKYGTMSRTEGVAWIESKEVSFRRQNPHLSTVLHELGHVYFEETDPIWNNVYGGGELLMWLIIKNKAEGNEDSIKKWHKLMHLAYENPTELLTILDKTAGKVAKNIRVSLEEVKQLDYLPEHHPGNRHAIAQLMLFAGTLPHEDIEQNLQPILINILEGVRWGEYIWGEMLKELCSPKTKPSSPAPRRRGPSP